MWTVQDCRFAQSRRVDWERQTLRRVPRGWLVVRGKDENSAVARIGYGGRAIATADGSVCGRRGVSSLRQHNFVVVLVLVVLEVFVPKASFLLFGVFLFLAKRPGPKGVRVAGAQQLILKPLLKRRVDM